MLRAQGAEQCRRSRALRLRSSVGETERSEQGRQIGALKVRRRVGGALRVWSRAGGTHGLE